MVGLFVAISFLGSAHAADAIKIGVLAKNGAARCLKQWTATAEYLSDAIKDETFEIVPLDFEQVYTSVEKGEVDFFLVNSSMFVTTQQKYGAGAIATMINSRQGKSLSEFGGVIITQIDNDEINALEDLRGKTFMAVKDTSFGGWQMAYKEIADAGIDPYTDFASLEFGKQHDNVALAVLNMAVDAGTVRTDTLERMATEGLIGLEDFKIINQQKHTGFPFVCSTPLYPEWPMAKTKNTPDALAAKVVEALKKLSSDDKAAKNAKIVGWSDPLDYTPVKELQETLKIDAFKE